MDGDRHVPNLTDDEKRRWDDFKRAISKVSDRLAGVTSEELPSEPLPEFTDEEMRRIRDSLHVPDDAGEHEDALIAMMLRIPDNWGRWIGCDAGWFPLITDLDQQLAALDPNYELHQCKEKVGGLRYYAHTDLTGEAADEFDSLIDAAERQSFAICERCGQPGAMAITATRWLKTLCDDCMGAEPDRGWRRLSDRRG